MSKKTNPQKPAARTIVFLIAEHCCSRHFLEIENISLSFYCCAVLVHKRVTLYTSLILSCCNAKVVVLKQKSIKAFRFSVLHEKKATIFFCLFILVWLHKALRTFANSFGQLYISHNNVINSFL